MNLPELFLKLLNMSISASWLVLAVLLLRFALKKAPRWAVCGLWAIVGIRLVFPFSIESVYSLIPSTQTLPQDILTENRFQISSGVPVIDHQINDVILDSYYEGITVPTDNGLNVMSILTIVWLVGMAILVTAAIVTYLRLRRQVSASIRLRDNLYLCDYIESPFILGIIRPRIYLPSALEETQWPHVVAHEKAHLQRRDHWWKPLGFALLCLHWFNPLIWIAYILLCRDIELACDEKVIKELGETQKKAYSEALLECSVPRYMIAACPLAFGEVGVKERVRSILNYKKPAFWVILVSLILCLAVAVCFLTDPLSGSEPSTIREFRATVLEVQENQILVRPTGDYPEYSSSPIWVALPQDTAHITEGDTVRIVYDGLIRETYPAVISSAYLVTGIDPAADVANMLQYRLGSNHFGGTHLQDGILIVSVVKGYHDLPESGTEVIDGITVVYRQVDMPLTALEDAAIQIKPQMGQYGIVNVRVDIPGNALIVSVYQEELDTRQFIEQYIDAANYTMEYLENASLTPGQENTTNVITLNPRQQLLAKEYPCYFGLPTGKGLEIYTRSDLFQVRYVLMQGTNRIKELDEIEALPALTVQDMKDILATYDIPASSVFIFNNSDLSEEAIRSLLGIPVSPAENKWRVQFYATNVSPTGLTLICKRGGGFQDVSLLTGRYYWVEKLGPEGWQTIDAGERTFLTDAQGIAPSSTVSWSLDWTDTYGALEPGQYRIGKHLDAPDGETMTFYAQFQVLSGRTIESTEDWGISLSLTDVTSTGATLVCSRNHDSQLELRTGGNYDLQILTQNGWVSLQVSEYNTSLETYFIPQGDTVTWSLDWSGSHGVLLPGTYRVVKTFTTGTYPGDQYYQSCSVEFVIQNAVSSLQFSATILEVTDTSILVEPLPGTVNHPGMDQLWVSRSLAVSGEIVGDLAVGDIVSILYNGFVAETYPGQIIAVYAIEIQPEHPDAPKDPIT